MANLPVLRLWLDFAIGAPVLIKLRLCVARQGRKRLSFSNCRQVVCISNYVFLLFFLAGLGDCGISCRTLTLRWGVLGLFFVIPVFLGLPKLDVLSALGGLQLLNELLEGSHEILFQLEFIVVHISREMEVRLLGAYTVQFYGVLVWDKRVFLPMQEKDWTLGLCDQVNVPEALVDDHGEEASPTEEAFRCVLDAHIGRHEKERVAFFARGQVRRWTATHAPTEQDHVALLDAHDLSQIVVDGVSILLHLFFIRLASLVESVAGILDRQHMHLHARTKHIHEVEGQSDVLSISMEVDTDLVSAIFARQVETWNVLAILIVDLLGILLLLDRCACLGTPHEAVLAFLSTLLLGLCLGLFLSIWLLRAVSLCLEPFRGDHLTDFEDLCRVAHVGLIVLLLLLAVSVCLFYLFIGCFEGFDVVRYAVFTLIWGYSCHFLGLLVQIGEGLCTG